MENQEIEFNDLLIYFRGIIYQLWKSNADRLLDIINNEETEIDKILEKVKGLPEFRRYKFYKKFSKSLNETFYAEINSMKYELKKAMYSYDKKEILRISSDLWRLNTICFPKIGIEEEEVFFIYLQNILWNSTYSKLLVGDVLSEFKNYFLMLEQNQKKSVVKNLRELISYSNSDNIMEFIEGFITDNRRMQDEKEMMVMQEYKQWRDRCLLAFKQKKFGDLLKLLQAREEYKHMKNNDVLMLKKVNSFFYRVEKYKDQEALYIIFEICSYYKKFFV